MPTPTIHPRFAVPIAEMTLPQAAQLNPALRERFLAWEQDEGERSSVPTPVDKHAVYESDFSLFYREDPIIAQLAQHCLNALGTLIMRLNHYSAEEMRNLRIYHHSWFHITRHGGYTGNHNHPMASWSGVYCVSPGEEVEGHANNGALRFEDSRINASMYLDPGNAHLQPPFATGHLAYQLQAGQLLLFPSWLLHEVTPFWGRDERITVAFNAWVREAGQAVDEPGLRLRREANSP